MEDVTSNMPPPAPENVVQPWPTQTREAAGPSSANTGQRKEMKLRSIAWDHFTKFTNEDGEIKARCDHCEKVFPAHPKKNGTKQLLTHMTMCKKRPYSVKTARQAKLIFEKDDAKGATVLKCSFPKPPSL